MCTHSREDVVSISYQSNHRDTVFENGNMRRLKVQINNLKTQFRVGNVGSLKRRNLKSTPE